MRAIVGQIVHLSDLIRRQDWSTIDGDLSETDMAAAPVMLIATLRATFMVRSKLQEWRPLLSRTRAALSKRGLDADSLLRGL